LREKKNKGPKQDSQNRSPMPEGVETLILIIITLIRICKISVINIYNKPCPGRSREVWME